jgi:hypothetical protein
VANDEECAERNLNQRNPAVPRGERAVSSARGYGDILHVQTVNKYKTSPKSWSSQQLAQYHKTRSIREKLARLPPSVD